MHARCPERFCGHYERNALWFDQNGNPDVRFETATDETGILISVELPADDVADAFERRFGNTQPATHVIAA